VTLHTQALVLRVRAFGESDRIVHLLTPEWGRVTVIAKGARRSRKRFPGTLDLFNQLAVHLERRRPQHMPRLEAGRLLEPFPALRAHPARFALACYLVELLDRLATEAAAGGLYRVAVESLHATARLEPHARLQTLLELRLLDALGLRPELRRCVRCGREVAGTALVFHIGEGGPLCASCETPETGAALRIHLGTLRALEHGLALPLERLDRLRLVGTSLAEARALLARFQRFHVGVECRSERFLSQTLRESRLETP